MKWGIHQLNGLEAQNLIVEQCPDLATIYLSKSTPLNVRVCPRGTRLRGRLPGDLIVENRPDLLHLGVVFPRDACPVPGLASSRHPQHRQPILARTLPCHGQDVPHPERPAMEASVPPSDAVVAQTRGKRRHHVSGIDPFPGGEIGDGEQEGHAGSHAEVACPRRNA